MSGTAIRNALLVFVLAGAALAIGCGGGAEGKYRDPSGTINAEFKDGKAYVALGAYAVDGWVWNVGSRCSGDIPGIS